MIRMIKLWDILYNEKRICYLRDQLPEQYWGKRQQRQHWGLCMANNLDLFWVLRTPWKYLRWSKFEVRIEVEKLEAKALKQNVKVRRGEERDKKSKANKINIYNQLYSCSCDFSWLLTARNFLDWDSGKFPRIIDEILKISLEESQKSEIIVNCADFVRISQDQHFCRFIIFQFLGF